MKNDLVIVIKENWIALLIVVTIIKYTHRIFLSYIFSKKNQEVNTPAIAETPSPEYLQPGKISK